MSDVWQGPGWWLASDGKWYPDDARPGAVYGDIDTATKGTPDESEDENVDDGSTRPDPSNEEELGSNNDGVSPDRDVADEEHTIDSVVASAETAIEAETLGEENAAQDKAEPAETDTKPDDQPKDTSSGWQGIVPAVAPPIPESINQSPPLPPVDLPQAESISSASTSSQTSKNTDEAMARQDAWRTAKDTVTPTRGDADTPSKHLSVIEIAPVHEPELDETPERDAFSSKGVWAGLTIVAFGAIAAIGIVLVIIFVWINGDDDDTETQGPLSTLVESTPVDETTPEVASVPETDTTIENAPGTEDSDTVSVFELEAGDCLRDRVDPALLTEVARVGCDEPHQMEVYSQTNVNSSITEWDSETIEANADEECRDALVAYIGTDGVRDIRYQFLIPSFESWNNEVAPDRAITCILFFNDSDEPTTGRAA